MAIAVNGGHVARALDFYNSGGKYFVIGGTTPWTNEAGEVDDTTPIRPSVGDFKLNDIVGFKRVDNIHLVVPTEETEDVISYRNQNWKKVDAHIETTVGSTGVTIGSRAVPVNSVNGFKVGSKIRVADKYEGTITSISGLILTLDTEAPESISSGKSVVGGAIVEGAKYVYVDCYLNYDEFPLVTYRQIGLCTGVAPDTEDILRAARHTTGNSDEYTDVGLLEVLDNRVPSTRDISQRELISLIIEF